MVIVLNVSNNQSNAELMELERIINTQEIKTVFQPIVSLKDASIIGYEALSRGPEDSILHFPDKLFKAAEKYQRLWELESLCRIKAIERSAKINQDSFLFLNVDPHIFNDEKFKKGFTKEFLSKHNISPETIIFEITEKTSIEDYRSFNAALNNYIEQGYKIAIDDMGSGYSGLKMLSETKPHYVKIDMDLIRNIDKDPFKQALIRCFVSLAEVTNMKLIAEGIETEDELLMLMDLDVHAGQGYFLQKPSSTFLDLPESIVNIIFRHNIFKDNKFNHKYKHYIGQIARRDDTFASNVSCGDIKKYFEQNNITGACIADNGYPVGIVMNHSLNSALATQYGVAVFSRRPVSLVMDKNPLIVDYYSTITDVSKAAMTRSSENLYDYVIITKENKYYGVITIRNLLEHTTKLECTYAKELNPLTELPGNSIIEAALNDILSYDHKCCVLYFDLDNFKIYNDSYGFENGDKIIKFTGQLIQDSLKSMFPYNSFLGHIGGDDFVCTIEHTSDKCHELCSTILEQFDRKILEFFNEKDRNNGYIEATDRKGNIERFNLTSLSIAGLYKNFKEFSNVDEIAQYVSSIKKEIKMMKGSNYLIIE